RIEEKITSDTVAIMPVHVYGNMCDVKMIDEIAKKHGLKVIYDAAHTFGVKLFYEGEWRGSGSFGDLSCFSFHATKVFNTIEGGAVCCSTRSQAERIKSLRDFGIVDEETVSDISPNAKMNEFSACMGLCNLRHVDSEIEKRRAVNDAYREALKDVPGIRLLTEKEDQRNNYAYFPIFVNRDEYGASRDELFLILKKNGYGSRKYFYPLVTDTDCYRDSFKSADTPVAERLAASVLTIPMYADLGAGTARKIAEVIRSHGNK
ncbi:MAG: DegT/DnrJ/EryC1/StrS family aminotransferase, partial [Lachnospiraceae bacterium]|nr:DegT/DnrJ/EryC1/StrS family aminotransferase [Lachnospiraceae bacterium]